MRLGTQPSRLKGSQCQQHMILRRAGATAHGAHRCKAAPRAPAVRVAAVATRHSPSATEPAARQERPPAQASQPLADSDQTFSFEQQWWPCAVLATFDKARPHALELLGRQLALWYDAPAATWRACEDACPHRLAPLSEGRVDAGNGQIECAYHGWRFEGGSGACVRIPQATDDARACARCRVRTYPTREAAGLLFVWATPDDDARAAAAPLPLTQAIQDHVASGGQITWYRRLLPYGWDVLLENLADPSHLPFSHHGLAGLRRDKALPMPFTPLAIPDPGGPAGGPLASEFPASGGRPPCVLPHAQPVALFRYPTVSGESALALVAVSAPCSVSYYSRLSAITLSAELMAVPAGPGRSMAFTGNIIQIRPQANPLMRLLFRLAPKPPSWKNCLTYNQLFDQDSPFLAAQDAALRKLGGGRAWAKAYYMPVTCDRLIVALRGWVDKAGGGPAYPASADPPAPRPARRQVNDRWAQHTRECTACRAAAEGFRRRAALLAGAALAAAAAAAGALAGAGARRAAAALPAAVGAAVLLALAAWRAWRMLPKFEYVEYCAADND
ncbi:MAG: hypothetical protein J3K34DRAFT_516994 [Monoraphidium minutum]|nr:MAG: hypothetical protein J3K34DRAFT_516994 [Monoraphidium minutum]